MPTGPNRLSTIQRVVIRIDEVDIPNRAVHGYDKTNVLIVATFRETANGILYVPAQKERWIAERQGQGQWRLVTRLDSADQQAYVESTLGPGDMRIAAENIYFTGTVHGAGGGGGSVTSVTAGDASIVIGGTSVAPTVETADLSTISLLHPAVGDVSMSSHKIINLTPGVLGTDAATVSQIPTSVVSSFNTRTGAVTLLLSDVTGTGLSYSDVGALGATAAAGGDLTGNYPNPTIKTNVNLPGAPTTTTPSTADNSTKIATTAYVQAQGYLTSSTGVTSFNTRTGAVTLLKADVTGTGLSFSDVGALGATAAAGGDLAGNYPNPTIKSSVGLSGNPTTTTQTASDSSTKIATTAFTQAAIAAASVVKIQITQTSHGFSVGNVLYYTGSAYALAKADNADDAEVVGIVATVVDANNFILQAVGEVTGLSGLTAGTTYFLSDSTAGLLTATAPTANGSISKPLGVAVSTTVLFFFNFRGEAIQTNGSVSVTPSGAMMQYAGSTVPSGWLLCDGTSYPTATYPDLYNAIGYTYGGSGANFNVPDARGRILVGKDAGTFASLGGTGGAETVTLTATQIPGHTHSATTAAETTDHTHTISHTHTVGVSGAAGGTVPPAPGSGSGSATVTSSGSSAGSSGGRSASHTHTLTTDSGTGGGLSHNNLQPYLVVNQIIKT